MEGRLMKQPHDHEGEEFDREFAKAVRALKGANRYGPECLWGKRYRAILAEVFAPDSVLAKWDIDIDMVRDQIDDFDKYHGQPTRKWRDA
jgi:hypothetical protein